MDSNRIRGFCWGGLFQSRCDEMDIVSSMHLVFCPTNVFLFVDHQASLNLNMLFVLYKWQNQLSDGNPAADPPSLFSLYLPLSLCLFSPPWLVSRLSAAVSVVLEFKHCRLQQLPGTFQKWCTLSLTGVRRSPHLQWVFILLKFSLQMVCVL